MLLTKFIGIEYLKNSYVAPEICYIFYRYNEIGMVVYKGINNNSSYGNMVIANIHTFLEDWYP